MHRPRKFQGPIAKTLTPSLRDPPSRGAKAKAINNVLIRAVPLKLKRLAFVEACIGIKGDGRFRVPCWCGRLLLHARRVNTHGFASF